MRLQVEKTEILISFSVDKSLYVQDLVYSVDLARTFVVYVGFQFAITTGAIAIAAGNSDPN